MLWKLLQMRTNEQAYHQSAPWQQAQQAPRPAVPAGHELETAIPARPANLASDVAVPLLQAAVTGCMAGLALVIIANLAELDIDLFYLWGGASLGVGFIAWLVLLGQTRRLLWAIERLVGLDLDGDQVSGPPTKIQVEVTQGKQQMYLELPGSPQALATLARGVLGGRSFAEDSWSGRGQPFSRGEFRELRDALIERRLATWRNPDAPTQGVVLTAAGRAVFRRLAEL